MSTEPTAGAVDGRARRRRRPLGVTALASVLVVVGLVIAVVVLTSQRHAPQPPASAAGTVGATTTSSVLPSDTRAQQAAPGPPSSVAPRSTTSGSPSPPPSLPRSEPSEIDIPSIGVRSVVNQVGLNPDGTLEVPTGPQYDQAAWYRGSPTPGSLGPSVIEGHIDSAVDGPSVFFRLGDLRPGDEVRVRRVDGKVAVFAVSGVRRYPKNDFPTATVYGNTDGPSLRLITCGGSFDRSTGHYRDNTVVFAESKGRPGV